MIEDCRVGMAKYLERNQQFIFAHHIQISLPKVIINSQSRRWARQIFIL